MKDKLSTIVLNYNNSEDTLTLLGQLLDEPLCGNIIVIDNASTDLSENIIREFLTNKFLNIYKDKFTYKGDNVSYEVFGERLIFIQSPRNGGFAYGNNLGLYFSISNKGAKYNLILNNDIRVGHNFFINMMEFVSRNKSCGLWGSVLYLERSGEEKLLQGIGGVFNTITGRASHIGLYDKNLDKVKNYDINNLDYPIGACLLIDTDTINKIGYLNEEYFLYYEELDYIYRMKKEGINFNVCLDTELYHKCGSTIEKDKDENGISKTSQYYLNRSRHIFMKKYHPYKYYIFYVVDLLSKIKKLL